MKFEDNLKKLETLVKRMESGEMARIYTGMGTF